jgi:hypothetical protein
MENSVDVDGQAMTVEKGSEKEKTRSAFEALSY